MSDQHASGRARTEPVPDPGTVADPGASARRKLPGPPWLPWAIGGVLLLAVVVGLVVWLTGEDASEPTEMPSAVEVVLPEPTPVAEPVDRGDGSALLLSLPGAVRQFVLTAIAPSDAFAAAAALESVAATYTGPLDGSDVDYEVVVGQWPTAEEAAAQAATTVAAGSEPVSSGEVTVAGEPAGTYSIMSVDEETSTAVWTNGTVLLQATGPTSDIENFYLAFSL
ncbi:hypothetical protein [Sanguibacter antarcticus]|uniref:Uncharacterized protein n=1 Tax=Sanguibacter antarcticus TaxID=372484 RepID=A0A2A9E7F3_9MICO|nr:hypothetical protein [Sanguibacter antarcticus]PFG34162.1 hypothetical protein ATL42_2065 [Sanguibacter antarcticus]